MARLSMRFLRYLLYAILQLGFFGGLFWLYSVIRGVSLPDLNFRSTGLLTFVAVSFIPLIDMMRRQRRLPLARMPEIRSKLFLLCTTFHGRVKGTVSEVKDCLREICNAAVLTDRVFVLESETDAYLEYVSEPRLDAVDTKGKRRRFEATRVEINLRSGPEPASVDLEIRSSSDERDVGIDNLSNEENVGTIVLGLKKAGLLRTEAISSPIGYTEGDARDRLER
jgi:hypothetical protein